MFKGVHHIGIGVSDMDESLKFYRDLLGFKQTMFDHTGLIPGMEGITGKSKINARVVMLMNENTGPLGLGMLKLVQLLPPDKPDPCFVQVLIPGQRQTSVAGALRWGDIAIAEACFNTRGGTGKVTEQLAEKGVKVETEAATYKFPPYDAETTFSYVRDPDNSLIELADWAMGKSLATEAKVEGLNHVGFGVSDVERSREFYKELGFTDTVFDTFGRMSVIMMANYHGAWIEAIQFGAPDKPEPYIKGWGHLGPMEFAVEVTNLEKAYEELQEKSIKFLCPPQRVEVPSGSWNYAYVTEPDNLYVSLVEPRF
ncbi:MAG: VOC family protein [Dehalococcoidales bacterium]|nr:MAG: VOC family protein [Dehalococcoidales bacterium]